MELIRCHAENFGVLSNKSFDFSDGFNAICLRNGQGKSTLCAFIKCMLYGLSDSRSRDLLDNERKHYTPWQGGRFGGSITLRFEGRIYRIHRSFGTRPSEDRLEVFDEQSGAITDALGACPGETMLGMDARGFASCALFSEGEFEKSLENESVLALIGREENEQAGSLATALARLDAERRIYEKKGGRGLLAETESEISSLTAQHIEALREAESLSQKERDFLSAKAALAALTERTAASEVKNSPGNEKRHIRPFALLLALLSLLAFSALGFLKSPLFFSGWILSISLAFLAFIDKKRNNSLQNSKKCTKEAADATENQSATEQDKKAMFEACYQKCAACERAYEEALEAKEKAAFLALQIEDFRKKSERIARQLSDIKKAEELLSLAGKRYRESRTNAARESFAAHLDALGEQESEKFRLGDHFTPSVLHGDGYHSAEILSRGERDRVSLARSLSLLSAIPAEKQPPLLLDDPFLSYDDTNLSSALSALTSLSKERQILYFTCSLSRMP